MGKKDELSINWFGLKFDDLNNNQKKIIEEIHKKNGNMS